MARARTEIRLDPALSPDPHDRPLPELVKELTENVSTLVRQEIELAKAELSEKGKRAGIGALFLGNSMVMGMLAANAFGAFLILALAIVMPAWLAALLVAVACAVDAVLMARIGARKVREAMPPVSEETVDSVKEDVRWLSGRKH